MKWVGQAGKLNRAAPLNSIFVVRGITGSFGSRPGIGLILSAGLQETGNIDLPQLTVYKDFLAVL